MSEERQGPSLGVRRIECFKENDWTTAGTYRWCLVYGVVRLSEVAVKETFTVFLYQIEVLDWKRCRKAKKNLSQTTKGYNKRNRTSEKNTMRFEFSHVTRYNLGQNLLIHITKILIFCTRPPKKSPQIESPFHASPIPMLFAVTPEMHTWTFRPKQLWTRIGGGGGGGRFLFPLEMIVVLREITKHMEMSNELCPGL